MHDPMTVVIDMRRPWPRKPRRVKGKRWSGPILLRDRLDPFTGEQRPVIDRPYATPFVRLAGWEFYFPAWVTLWHVDPEFGGDDESCRRAWLEQHAGGQDWTQLRGWRRIAFRFGAPYSLHPHHWRVQILPLQALKRSIFERCSVCGGRYPLGYGSVVSTWGGDRTWHMECSPPREVKP